MIFHGPAGVACAVASSVKVCISGSISENMAPHDRLRHSPHIPDDLAYHSGKPKQLRSVCCRSHARRILCLMSPEFVRCCVRAVCRIARDRELLCGVDGTGLKLVQAAGRISTAKAQNTVMSIFTAPGKVEDVAGVSGMGVFHRSQCGYAT